MGKLDNTLIIYICGDNGTSPEGTLYRRLQPAHRLQRHPESPEALQLRIYEDWGTDKTYPHMSVGWTWAFDTPFKWTKQVASHFGGTRQGLAISWPGHIKDVGGIRSQFHHVIDIVPTILEATGIRRRRRSTASRRRPIEGVSMAYTFDAANAKAPSTRTTQYFEMVANRGIYHDGWIANTTPFAPPWDLATGKLPDVVNGYKWELYNISEDFSQNNDLAAKKPAKLKEMQALFLTEAAKYNVFPLDNTAFSRLLTPRPSAIAGKTVFTYTGENSGIPLGNAPSLLDKDYTITAEITVPEGGAEGMIVTLGGRFGGYGLYLLKGKPVFVYNLLDLERFRWEGGVGGHRRRWLGKALKPGKHTLVFDFMYDGPGPGKGGTGVFKVDGKETGQEDDRAHDSAHDDHRRDVRHRCRYPLGVDDSYELPFRFTGTIDKLTFQLGPSQLSAADQAKVVEAAAKAHD